MNRTGTLQFVLLSAYHNAPYVDNNAHLSISKSIAAVARLLSEQGCVSRGALADLIDLMQPFAGAVVAWQQDFDNMVQLDPIATVDLTDFQARKPEITKQLMAAASDIGFFRVKGALLGCNANMTRLSLPIFRIYLLHSCEMVFTNPAAAG